MNQDAIGQSMNKISLHCLNSFPIMKNPSPCHSVVKYAIFVMFSAVGCLLVSILLYLANVPITEINNSAEHYLRLGNWVSISPVIPPVFAILLIIVLSRLPLESFQQLLRGLLWLLFSGLILYFIATHDTISLYQFMLYGPIILTLSLLFYRLLIR